MTRKLNDLRKKKFKDEKIRLNFQERISICLSYFFKSGSVDKKGIELLFQYIIKSIRQRGCVFEEILQHIKATQTICTHVLVNSV